MGKLVANIWVKDEIQLIESFLERTSEWADEIVALDNGSTDGTYEILKGHPKVKKLFRDSPGTPVAEKRIRNLLLEAARERRADWIMIIDADEILDRRFAERRDDLMSRTDVAWYHLLEITTWRSPYYFRVDKPDWYMRKEGTCRLAPLTPGLKWDYCSPLGWKSRLRLLMKGKRPEKIIRSLTSQLYGATGEIVYRTDIVRLHYHFVDRERSWRRHLRYGLYDAIEKKHSLYDIDKSIEFATRRLDETGLRLAHVLPEWGALPIRNGSVPSSDPDLEKYVDHSYSHADFIHSLNGQQ